MLKHGMTTKNSTTPTNKGKGRAIRWLHAHFGHEGEECLIWPFARDDKGYGFLGHNGKILKAHRVMCEWVNGSPPEDRPFSGHSCGNGHLGCVHPQHLKWTNNSENQLDRTAHGRPVGSPYGHKGKLTAEQVAEIQAERGKTTIRELAKRYGVKRGAIDYWHKMAKRGIGYTAHLTDWKDINQRTADRRRNSAA
jgi:hypothetical protein